MKTVRRLGGSHAIERNPRGARTAAGETLLLVRNQSSLGMGRPGRRFVKQGDTALSVSEYDDGSSKLSTAIQRISDIYIY